MEAAHCFYLSSWQPALGLLVMAAALLALCGLISRAKRLRDSGRGWVMAPSPGASISISSLPSAGRRTPRHVKCEPNETAFTVSNDKVSSPLGPVNERGPSCSRLCPGDSTCRTSRMMPPGCGTKLSPARRSGASLRRCATGLRRSSPPSTAQPVASRWDVAWMRRRLLFAQSLLDQQVGWRGRAH